MSALIGWISCDRSIHVCILSLYPLSTALLISFQHAYTIKLSKQWRISSKGSRSIEELDKVIDEVDNLFKCRATLCSIVADSEYIKHLYILDQSTILGDWTITICLFENVLDAVAFYI